MATVTSSTRKLNPTSNTYETNSGLTVGTNIVVGGTVDGRDIASDGSKLDGIAVGANNYSLPAGSSSTRGGFKIGYSQSGKNYPIVVSSEKMYVNVPWTDTNTTYSVGDGGLTQKNFTTTLKSKLDGIAAGATNVTNNNQLTNGAGYVTTNTTYSVGDGGLTQNNFTNADHTKLNGIATGADVTPSWVPSSNPSYATQSYVGTQISNLVGGAPAALDTLNELAEAIGDDASYASSITSALAAKAPLASPTFTGTVTTPNLTIGSGNKIKFANNDYIRYDDANGVGRFHFDSDGGTNNSSVQAATFVGALSGNASTATTLATARTIALSGDVTGSVSFNGSSNVSISTLTNKLRATDDRDVKPNTTGIGASGVKAIKAFFTTFNGMTGSSGGAYQDMIALDTYSDSSGGGPSAMTFSKGASVGSPQMYIWKGAYGGTTWGTGQRVFADNYHPNADTLTTARTIAGTSFNGSANINISYNNLINKPTIPTNNNQLTNGAGYVTTDTNTTYSVGDGGLTQKNFTTTLKSKLDGIATSANNYSLPAASSSTRGGVKIGYTESGRYYPVELSSEKMFVHVPWVDTNTNTTYSVGDGGLTQKNFTTTLKSKLDGIATSANNYSLPAGSSSTRGGFKIGYTESGRYYPVEVSSEKMFVHVPWVDTNTNTTYSVGDGGLTQKNFTTTLKSKLDGIATSANNYSLPAGSSSTRGGFKIGYTESGKNYPVEVSSEKMYVNVPWSDSNTTYSVGDGGLTQKNFTSTLKTKLDGIATGATNVTNNNQLTNGAGYVTTNTTYSAGSGLSLSSTTFSHSDTSSQGSVNNSSGTVVQDVTLDTYGHITGLGSTNLDDRYARRYEGSASNISNSGYTTVATVSGGALMSAIRMTVAGTTNSVVVANILDIIVNHYQDIQVEVLSGVYTRLFVKIISNNNDSYAIQVKTNNANAVTLSFNILALHEETVTFTSSHSYTGATLEVDCEAGKVIKGTGGDDGDLKSHGVFRGNGSGLTSVDADTLDGSHASAFQAAGTYNTIIGTDSDINTSGATVVDQLNMTDGVIQSHSTRTLTLANLGYTGATNANYITNNNQLTNGAGYVTTNTTYSVGDGGLTQKNFTTTLKSKLDGIATSANNYSLPAGSSSTRGGFKIGYTESGKNYPVEVSSEKMYVNVPWVDTNTNTTYSVGDGGLTQKNFTSTLKTKLDGIATSANNYSLPEATATARGGIELFSNTDQSVAANSVSATASRTYGIQLNSAGQAVVNVPWSDTNTDTNTTYSAGRGLDLSGTQFQLETDLRDSISYIGYDSNDYLQWSNNSYVRAVVSGTERFRVNTSGIDVTGTATANAFRTDTGNTDYNVISRNSTSTSLWVQAAGSGSIQGIASFRYGSATVNQGTEVCAIRRNSSYFINTKLGVGTNNPQKTLDVSGTVQSSGDIEVTSSSAGVILKSPNGSRWRVTVNNSGMVATTNVS